MFNNREQSTEAGQTRGFDFPITGINLLLPNRTKATRRQIKKTILARDQLTSGKNARASLVKGKPGGSIFQ